MDRNPEEFDDYMSDTLLHKIDDIRPGIVSKSVAKRYKIENEQILNNSKNKRLKLSQMEKETREEALSKPISSDNKGFALMSKMGYKPGMVLGKKSDADLNVSSAEFGTDDDNSSPSTSSSNALKVPITVDLKLDRKGLGHLAKSKEKLAQLESVRKVMQLNRKIIHEDFESRKRDFVQNKTVNKNLLDSQKVCFELDSRLGLSSPQVIWFWPHYVKETLEDSDQSDSDEELVEDQISIAEKLSSITNYLRITHFYCVWCGIKYEDENDLKSNCPGGTKEAHDSEDLSNDL